MKKLVIFKDVYNEKTNKKDRITLRAITPQAQFCGYSTKGAVIESEFRKLAQVLEPSMTGFYIA